jgi:hypothetical protein
LGGIDGGSIACEKVVADVMLVLTLESVVEQGILVPLLPEVAFEDFLFK